jgi:hypothetical protein
MLLQNLDEARGSKLRSLVGAKDLRRTVSADIREFKTRRLNQSMTATR